MPRESIEVNESGWLLTRSDGSQSLLLPHELLRVQVLNEDEVYFLLEGPNVSLVITQGAQGTDLLLKHLQKLPGFNNQQFVTAMSTTGKFLCWTRPESASEEQPK